VPKIGVATQTSSLEALVDADLDTLATALYVRIDDWLKTEPHRAPWRPAVGLCPQISDAELVTLAVLQALLGFVSEARWLRFARAHLAHLFPYLPRQPGYNKRLRRLAATMKWLTSALARDTSVWSDDVWVVDSTPVECGRSRQTALRSDLAGWAEYGYCASHSRYFWGLRLHLVCTLHGLPVGFALTGAKTDERQALLDILADPALTTGRPGQIIIGDKNYYGRDFEAVLAAAGLDLLRPARKGEPERAGTRFFKPLRQVIESVNDTFKGQLDLERHGGHTPTRGPGPRAAAHPCPDRGDLAQRPRRPARQALPAGLRPLTPWNRSSRGARRSPRCSSSWQIT
jgi:hypothetical protein